MQIFPILWRSWQLAEAISVYITKAIRMAWTNITKNVIRIKHDNVGDALEEAVRTQNDVQAALKRILLMAILWCVSEISTTVESAKSNSASLNNFNQQ